MNAVDIIVNFIFTALSVVISIYMAYLGVDRKLDRIIEREHDGVLTKPQAEALVDIYLEMIKKALQWEVDDYCKNHLEELPIDDNENTVRLLLDHVIEARYLHARENIARRFVSFKISKKKTFLEFIQNVSRASIPKSSDEVLVAILDFLKAKEDAKSGKLFGLTHLLSTKIAKRNEEGRKVMIAELSEWYSKRLK